MRMSLPPVVLQRIQPLRERYEALPPNDKRALLIMIVAIAATVIYLLLSLSRDYQQSAITDYQDAREDYRWMQLNMEHFKPLASAPTATSASTASSENSLIAVATTSAKDFKLTFKRYQPEGETGLRLWIEAAEFDQVLRWANAMTKQGIVLEQLDIDRLEKQVGMVDARILIRR